MEVSNMDSALLATTMDVDIKSIVSTCTHRCMHTCNEQPASKLRVCICYLI